MSANAILPQTSPSGEFDNYGWPIDPTTGQPYDYADLIADPQLRHQDPKIQNLIDQARARRGAPAPARRKTRQAHRCRSRRTFRADSVLAKMTLETKNANALAELVNRVNGGAQ